MIKHKLTQEATNDVILLLLAHFPEDYKPKMSLYRLKKYFQNVFNEPMPECYYMCSRCGEILPNNQTCQEKECKEVKSRRAIEFYLMDIHSKLKNFFKGE